MATIHAILALHRSGHSNRGLPILLAGWLRRAGLRARTGELKIRSSDFRTWHRAQVLPQATNLTARPNALRRLWRPTLVGFGCACGAGVLVA